MVALYQTAGYLILGSRFKRLGERVLAEIRSVYHEVGVAFEPSWFPVFYLLNEEEVCTIKTLAAALEVSHSAMSQSIAQLEKKGLVRVWVLAEDSRKKQLSLTDAGLRLLKEVLPIWKAFEKSFRFLLEGDGMLAKTLLLQMDYLEVILSNGQLSKTALQFLNGRLETVLVVLDAGDIALRNIKERYHLSVRWTGQGLGLKEGGQLVAFAAYRCNGVQVIIEEIFVLPAYRNNGLGKHLLGQILQLEKKPKASFLLQTAHREVINLLVSSGYSFSVVQ